MKADIQIHLGRHEETVSVERRKLPSAEFIEIRCEHAGSAVEFVAFGSPEELDALIDRIAQLRRVEA